MAYWKLLRMIITSDPPKGRVECSNCGYHIDRYNYEPLPDQCPNCGEDMGDIGAKINWRKDEAVTTTGPIGTVTLPKYGMNGWQNIEPTLLPPLSTEGPINDMPKMMGWTCPVCGRGLSPFTQFCPCKGFPKFDVTC